MIYEHQHRGHLWRLEVTTFKGRSFANWRKWYDKEGEWKPTKEGFTMPLEGLGELTGCLLAYHGLERPTGLQIAS